MQHANKTKKRYFTSHTGKKTLPGWNVTVYTHYPDASTKSAHFSAKMVEAPDELAQNNLKHPNKRLFQTVFSIFNLSK